MGFEIERKYLVTSREYERYEKEVVEICQGYLSRDKERVVRVRTYGNRGYLTIKTLTKGCVRHEYEYEIPHSDAVEMLDICLAPVICKRRHIVPYSGHRWEVDEFLGSLKPLTVAEIELSDPDEDFDLPSFIGREVTGDPAYYNSNLGNEAPGGETPAPGCMV